MRIRTGQADRISVVIQPNPAAVTRLDLLIRNLGGTITRTLKKLNLRVVDVPANAVEALAKSNDVRYISPNRQAASLGHINVTTGTDEIRVQTSTLLGGLVTTTTVFDGSGIGIAVIDSGIDSNHQAFRNQLGVSRVIASRDFTGEGSTTDTYGHGTHVASLAAGNEQISNGAYTGIASNANIINLRVLNSGGAGNTSGLLAALDWVMTYHSLYNIRVVNLSIGTPAIDSYLDDPLCRAVRQLTDAGIVVIAAAGNNGKSVNGQKVYGQIHSPGNESSAITVGAANTFGSDSRSDDTITSYSSRGPTRSFWLDVNGVAHYDNLVKPDLVAPGNRIVGAAAFENYLLSVHPELNAANESIPSRRMMYLSGSSMASPIVTGTVALMLQANPSLTPSLVKAILMYTAQPLLGANTLEQGAGELNVEGAMRLAKLVRGDLTNFTPLGATLLTTAAPAEQTSMNGESFSWARGIVLNHGFATGTNLITKYQKVYGVGFVLSDGVIETLSSQSIDSTRMTGGLVLGSGLITSNGTTLGGGTLFLDFALLLGDGLMLPDGIIVGDGIMVGDGIIVGDGIMVGDTWLQPQSVLTGGDDTLCMR